MMEQDGIHQKDAPRALKIKKMGTRKKKILNEKEKKMFEKVKSKGAERI